MKFEFRRGETIEKTRLVKVKRMNHLIEVVSVDRECDALQNIRKISKTQYVRLDTGEVMEYNLSENRADNIAGLKDSFRKIRDLINNNFQGLQNELHLTLTYADNVRDLKRIYDDFQAFWKRFKRKYGDNFEYLAVVEPQGRGAWHYHLLVKKMAAEKLFIPSNDIAALWKQGFVKVKALEGVDNIGAYLSAYLTDIELSEDTVESISSGEEIKTVHVDGQSKKIIKGGRLHMYPPGMNLYRKSNGIKPPEVQEMRYQAVKEIIGNATPDYSKTVTILDDDEKELNKIIYENYNMRRLTKTE